VNALGRWTVELDVQPASAWSRLSTDWRALAEQAPNASFFLTADWADAWMTAFGAPLQPDILVFRAGGRIVGACMLVRRTVRIGPIPVTRLYLNMAGEDEAEDTTIEYNDVLCLDGWQEAVAGCLAAWLGTRRWDEFFATGLTGGATAATLEWKMLGSSEPSRTGRPSYYVDLAAARRVSPEFDQCIGPRSRKNVRRYLNQYRGLGEITTNVPADAEGAVAMLDEMIALHQATWQGRGKPGAFASPRIVELHRGLVRRTFCSGATQLIRVSAGDAVIGIAYNFVFRGRVCAYQQGLRLEPDRRLHPGFVTTACAIQYCLDHGFEEYDHLAGSHIDKQAMSTSSRTIEWVSWRRRTVATRSVDVLKRVRAAVTRQPTPEREPDEEAG
jgi:CelD/BcsL family acetyltransferase involved in cellulose biosynthesis